MFDPIIMTTIYTLLQGFCFNILLPAWAMVNAFLGI